MRPFGTKTPKEPLRKGYDTENAVYKKYGKEISVHDWIQGGKEGTIAKDIIKQAGGIMNLKGAQETIPDATETIDLNMDPLIAKKIVDAGKIARDNLLKAQEKAKLQKQQKKEETKGDAINE